MVAHYTKAQWPLKYVIQRVLLQNHLSSETKEFIPSAAKANHKNLEKAGFNAALV